MQIINPTLRYYPILRKLLTVRYIERNSPPKESYKERKAIYDTITEELSDLVPDNTLMVERCHKAIGVAQYLGNHLEEFYVKAIRTPDEVKKDLLEAVVADMIEKGHPWMTTRIEEMKEFGFESNGILYLPFDHMS